MPSQTSKKMFKTILSASALSLALLSGAASGATVAGGNGGFEQQAFDGTFETLYSGDISLTGWSIDVGSIDLINTYWAPSEGSYSVDMNGFYSAGTISTLVTGLTAGLDYVLSFDLAANPDSGPEQKNLNVVLGDNLVDETVTSLQSLALDWTTYTFRFTASSDTEALSFASVGDPNGAWGPALDNVTVASVPLPAGGLLLIGALGGIAALRRRKAV